MGVGEVPGGLYTRRREGWDRNGWEGIVRGSIAWCQVGAPAHDVADLFGAPLLGNADPLGVPLLLLIVFVVFVAAWHCRFIRCFFGWSCGLVLGL